MTIKPWIELSRETVFQKYSKRLDKVIFKMPSGIEADYYLTGGHSKVICIFGLTINNNVILVEQFRPGPQKNLFELPGGFIDKGETPLEAAKREFLEESGYVGDFEFVTESILDAYNDGTRCHFVAKNCRKVQEPVNTDTEFTKVVLMDLNKFHQHLLSGQLSDITTGYYGLDYLHLL